MPFWFKHIFINAIGLQVKDLYKTFRRKRSCVSLSTSIYVNERRLLERRDTTKEEEEEEKYKNS